MLILLRFKKNKEAFLWEEKVGRWEAGGASAECDVCDVIKKWQLRDVSCHVKNSWEIKSGAVWKPPPSLTFVFNTTLIDVILHMLGKLPESTGSWCDLISSKLDVSCILVIVICNIFGSALQGQLCCSNLCLCEVLDASQFNICIAEFNVNVWRVQQPAAEFSVQCWSRPQQTEDRSSLSLKRHLTVLPPYSTTNKQKQLSEYIVFLNGRWESIIRCL